MEARAPAHSPIAAFMGGQRKPSGSTPAKRSADGGRADVAAHAPAGAAAAAAPAAAEPGLAPGASRAGSTAGAIGLFQDLLSSGEPAAKRSRTEATPRGRQRAAVVVRQRGGAKAFKAPAVVTSQPPASAGEAAAEAVPPAPAQAAATAAEPARTHADGAQPLPSPRPPVAPPGAAFESDAPAPAPHAPPHPRLSDLFSPGFDAAAQRLLDQVESAAAAAASPPPAPQAPPAAAPAGACDAPPSVDDAYENLVARSLRSGGAGGTPAFAATRGGTAGGGTAHTSQPSRQAPPPASPDPVAALIFSPAAARPRSAEAPMEDAAPESLHPGDESELDAMRAALAAPHAGGDELPDDDLESGPLDDADYAVDEELAAEVALHDDELEQAMTQMPLRVGGGDQRKLDVAAFIACKTQLERSGSRGSGSQRRWPAKPDMGGLQSHGEPHQLSYYGLNGAICQVYESKGMTRLYDWQVEALAQPGVLAGGSLVYSAPTSAGKSLVADVLLLRSLLRSPRRGVLVVLPYNALCDEKAASLERLAQPLGVQVHRHYSDRNGPLPSGELGIIVCTFEKANTIVARLIETDRLCAVGCVVVDELHMLSDEGRGSTLESLCATLLYYSFIEAGTSDADLHSSPALRSQQQRLRSAEQAELQFRIQMIGMSATLPNFSVLGVWWRAATYVTGFRPTPLVHRFVQGGKEMTDSNGGLVRTLEPAPVSKDLNDCVMVHLVQETINAGGSVLVFCAAKNDTVNAARVLMAHLSMPEPPVKSMAQDDLTREEAVERITMARPADKQLPFLAECVGKGVAFHNSVLNLDEREVVQDCFRFGKIRVICCTSTLAAGVNLPARRVMLRQDYAFGSLPGVSKTSQVPLQPAQYQQMAGRAGRTGLDTTGESIIIAKPNANAAHMAELRKLVLPDPRPLTSALATRSPTEDGHLKSNEFFKLFVLYAVSSGLVVTDMDMKRYVECTLLATLQTEEERSKGELRMRFNRVAQELFTLRLLAKEQAKDVPPGMPKPPEKWVVTAKGKSVVASSLPVDEAKQLQDDIEKMCKMGLILTGNHLHALYVAAPSGVYIPFRWKGVHLPKLRNIMESVHGDEAQLLARILELEGDPDPLRLSRFSFLYDPEKTSPAQLDRGARLQRLHAAMVMRDLAVERPMEDICKRYGFESEADVMRLQECGSRSMYCAAAMCEALGHPELKLLFASLQQRILAGTQQELVELADVPGVNRLRARALYNSGIQTLDALVAQSWEMVAEALCKVNPSRTKGLRFADRRLAEKILRNARSAVAERSRNNRQETLAKLAAAGFEGEALQKVAEQLEALGEAAAKGSRQSAGPASLQSPAGASAALVAAADRAMQLRTALAAAAAVVDTSAPPLQPPPPLPRGPRDEAFEASVAAQQHLLSQLSGACMLGEAGTDGAAFEALLRSASAAPLYGFAFAVRHDDITQSMTVHGLALALRPLGGVVYVPFDGAVGDARRAALAAMLAQPGAVKAALHVKEQIKALACRAPPQDVPSACMAALGDYAEDSFICAYLLAPDRERDSDKPDTFKLLDVAGVPHAAVLRAARFNGTAGKQPLQCVQEAAFAAAAALAVRAPLRTMLEGPAALHVPLREVEMPLVPVLAAMELLGVPFRRQDLDDPIQKAQLRLMELEHVVRNGVGLPTLRLTAPADVSYGLFVHRARGRVEPLCAAPPGALKTRQVRRNGQKVPSYSTDKATLEQVLRTNARVPRVASVVAAVLEHRSLQDLVSTCESLRKRRDVGDGRLHGTFLQTKAETGRLAMDEPSLHNIPHARQFTLGSAPRKHTLALRAAFAPARGKVLLLADYRQFELRMMLNFAGDAELTARLVGPDAPCDPFRGLAALWCGKDAAAVTEDERAWAKTVSYGLLYGKAVSTMAFDLNIDVAQAQLMVDAFKESMPAIKAWLTRCVEDSRQQQLPGVTTVAGRRRLLPDLIATGDNWRARGAAERQAVNTVCQGSAADVMKRAMTQLQRHLAADPACRATLLLSVHDDVMLEVDESALPELAALTRAVMVQAGVDAGLRVPLAVRLRHGPNWHSLADMD